MRRYTGTKYDFLKDDFMLCIAPDDTNTTTIFAKEDIFDCYKMPSKTKIKIFNDWKKYLENYDNQGVRFEDVIIPSHNTNTFSISADCYYKDFVNPIGYCLITKCYTRLFLFDNE